MDKTTPANPTLRELLAAPVSIAVGSGSILVRPMGWYQGSEALEVLLPVIDEMPMVVKPDGTFAPGDTQAWVLFAVRQRDVVAAFCAKASGLADADIRALQPTLLIELLLGLLEVNADFFVQSLPVLAQRAAGRLVAIQASIVAASRAAVEQLAKTGSTTSSPSSSQPGTASSS